MRIIVNIGPEADQAMNDDIRNAVAHVVGHALHAASMLVKPGGLGIRVTDSETDPVTIGVVRHGMPDLNEPGIGGGVYFDRDKPETRECLVRSDIIVEGVDPSVMDVAVDIFGELG